MNTADGESLSDDRLSSSLWLNDFGFCSLINKERMKEKKKKKGLARLMEIAGQRKGLLIVAGTLSALSSACMLVPYWAVYEVLRLLLTGNAASGEMVHWGWVAFGGLVAGLVLLYLALMASPTWRRSTCSMGCA